jgi:hypothetical protein
MRMRPGLVSTFSVLSLLSFAWPSHADPVRTSVAIGSNRSRA